MASDSVDMMKHGRLYQVKGTTADSALLDGLTSLHVKVSVSSSVSGFWSSDVTAVHVNIFFNVSL